MVQTVMVLTIFLCAAAGISDAQILLLMQVCIIVAVSLTTLATRRWTSPRVMVLAAALWCLGAICWWNSFAPVAAAILLGFGLGTATVISWAGMPAALERFSESSSGGAAARAYAGLTVLRDLTSSVVPVLTTLTLNGRQLGSIDAGHKAAGLLIVTGLSAALALFLLQSLNRKPLPVADAERVEAPM
jgi:Na+/melibiose symporter-like transporter